MTPLARAAVLLACGLAAGAPRAQTAQSPEPQRVEITAGEETDTDKRRRDPVAKQIYGREELDRYGDVSVTDVLKRLPGVTLQGGNPRLRGLGAGYTLILVNGEPAPPGFSLENLSPSMVERIEVSKGPTAEYSAQAVAGTINVVLRQAARQRQRELRLGLGYNTARPVPSANLVWSDRFDALSVTLPLSAYQWRGSNDQRGARQDLDAAGQAQRLVNSGRDDWWGGGVNIAPRLSWKLDQAFTLDWQSFAQRNEYRSEGLSQATVLQGLPPPSVDDRYGNQGHYQVLRSSLQLTRRSATGGRIEARLGGQLSQGASRAFTLGNDADGGQTVDRQTDSRNSERSITSSGKWLQPLGEAHNLGLGWDLEVKRRHEQRSVLESGVPQLVGFDGEPFQARVTRTALYAQDEWEISPQWSAYGGLRAERISTRSAGLADDLHNSSQVLSPLLHVNFKPVAGGRDLVRASLTRSYRAPELLSLMARPSINTSYPVSGGNTELSADRVGNPLLQPELATGLDIAYERYSAGGGVTSIGLFHRRLTDLIRNQVVLQAVPWSTVPRWVSTPVNLAGARSTGVELEVKGKANELLPVDPRPGQDWALRASLAVYRSAVQGLPGPDNRLEGQQPWSLTLGFDRQRPGDPLAFGASLAFTPDYALQQTNTRRVDQGRTRNLDAYVSWTFSREALLRLSVGNLGPVAVDTRTTVHDGSGFDQVSDSSRRNRAWFNASLTLKF